MSDYEFWDVYLKNLKIKLKELTLTKKELQIDLHIHSNYSADGKQSIKEILKTTKKKGFDVISITDHDSLDSYEELKGILKKDFTDPLIIPGVEFTIDNREYRNQCHILQLFVNPADERIKKDIKTNYDASFNRSKIQFQRLEANLAIQEVLKNNNLKISYEEYLKYLQEFSLFPEYDTICSYLISKFEPQKITNFKILKLLEKYNAIDIYEDRKLYKAKRYQELREKYLDIPENQYKVRFLLSMLAVREVDDDWWPMPKCGSLSVNSYGQLKINELNKYYPTYFAHPSENKLAVVSKLITENPHIRGLELNIRSPYNDRSNFYHLLEQKKLLKTIGSDSHDSTLKFYEDCQFFKIDSEDFKKIIE